MPESASAAQVHAPSHTLFETDFAYRFRPELAAGGYAHDDGTVEFYQRVVSLLPEGAAVLDYGAGRGGSFDKKQIDWRGWLLRLGHRHARRIGVDVDPAVHTNPELDEAHVVVPGGRLPFDDASFDLVLCDWVLEHVEDPAAFVSEVGRVLKPGGWFCARTPNKWSYYALGARLASFGFAGRLLQRLQPDRQEKDVFPKFYRFNTLAAVQSGFDRTNWRNASYAHNAMPGYHGNRAWLFRVIELWQNVTPASMRTVLLVFMQKRL